jgi:hypothetical protein
MATVRKLRQLPQTYGLSGRRTRTPIVQSYGERGRRNYSIPELAQLQEISQGAKEVRIPKLPEPPFQTKMQGGGGPGMGQVGTEGLGQIDPDSNALSETIGNSIMGSAVGRGVKGGASMGLMGLLAKAPNEAILQAIPSALISSSLAPIGLINTIGGGIVAGELGQNAADDAVDQGYVLTPSDVEGVAAAGARGASSRGGLIGMGIKGAKSYIPGQRSPIQDAEEIAGQWAANSHVANITAMGPPPGSGIGGFGGTGPGANNFGVTDAGLVGPADSNEAISQAFGVTQGPSGSGSVGGIPQPPAMTGANIGVGNAPASVTTPGAQQQGGLVERGFSAPQGAPGTTTGNYGGRGGGGGSGSVGGNMGGDLGAPGSSPGAPGIGGPGADGGGGGGGGGTVICTELHRQGLMSDEVYKKDALYGSSLDDNVMDGYQVWGKPLARAMAKCHVLTMIVKPFALRWANHMAGNHNWFGAVSLRAGIPMCRAIGYCVAKMSCLLKRQVQSTSQ